MWKKILSAILFCASPVLGEQTKTTYNPFTSKLDYITALSTNSIAAGTGIAVSTTSSGVTISASGGGGSTNGTIFSSTATTLAVYSNTTTLSGLTAGTSGQVLRSAGSSTNPYWSSQLPFGASNYIQNQFFSIQTASVSVNGQIATQSSFNLGVTGGFPSGVPFLWDGGDIGATQVYVGNRSTSATTAQATCVGDATCSNVLGGASGVTAVGYNAAHALTTGASNAFFGQGSGAAVTTSAQNTCLGDGSCTSLTTSVGGQNVAVGFNSMGTATTAAANTCAGYACLELMTTGINNATFGVASGADITIGNGNTCVGGGGNRQPCTGIKDGSHNTMIGGETGNIGWAGNESSNTLVGENASMSAGVNESICLGYNCSVSGSNIAQIGGSGTDAVRVIMSTLTVSSGTVSTVLYHSSAAVFNGNIIISSTVIDGNGTSGTSGQFLQSQGAGTKPLWATASGGASGSVLAVTTGTSSGFSSVASSPTAVVNFDSTTFKATLAGTATAYISLNFSSVTAQGLITASSLGVPAAPLGSVQYNNSGALGGSSNLTFDGTNLTNSGFIFAAPTVKPSFLLNASGANYGCVENVASNVWDLGYCSSQTSLGTSIIKWDSTPAVNILSSMTVTGAKGLNVTYGVSVGSITVSSSTILNGNLIISSTVIDGSGSAGTSGQFLKSNGPGTAVSWGTASGSGDMVLASTQTSTGAKTFSSYTNMTGSQTVSGAGGLGVTYGVTASTAVFSGAGMNSANQMVRISSAPGPGYSAFTIGNTGAFAGGTDVNGLFFGENVPPGYAGNTLSITKNDGTGTLFNINGSGLLNVVGGAAVNFGDGTLQFYKPGATMVIDNSGDSASSNLTLSAGSNAGGAACTMSFQVGGTTRGTMTNSTLGWTAPGGISNTYGLTTASATISGQLSANGAVVFSSGVYVSTFAITGNFTATSTTTVIMANCASNCTVTLPTAVGLSGEIFNIKSLSASPTQVTVGTTSSQTIDGVTTQVLYIQYTNLEVISDGSNWNIL